MFLFFACWSPIDNVHKCSLAKDDSMNGNNSKA